MEGLAGDGRKFSWSSTTTQTDSSIFALVTVNLLGLWDKIFRYSVSPKILLYLGKTTISKKWL